VLQRLKDYRKSETYKRWRKQYRESGGAAAAAARYNETDRGKWFQRRSAAQRAIRANVTEAGQQAARERLEQIEIEMDKRGYLYLDGRRKAHNEK